MRRSVNNRKAMWNRLGCFGVEVVQSLKWRAWIWNARMLTSLRAVGAEKPFDEGWSNSIYNQNELPDTFAKVRSLLRIPAHVTVAGPGAPGQGQTSRAWLSTLWSLLMQMNSWIDANEKGRKGPVWRLGPALPPESEAQQTRLGGPYLFYCSVWGTLMFRERLPQDLKLNSRCLARMCVCALAWNSLSVWVYVVSCPRHRLKRTFQDHQESDQEGASKPAEGKLLIIGDGS